MPSRTIRSTAWLPALLLAAFVIGTDDFIIAGILPEIAADLDVSEAAAGQLVTVFSLVYATTAPIMAVATARLPRRRLIVAGLAVFTAVNLATAFAATYAAVMVLRVAAAVVAAAISPAAFAVAAELAAPGRTGRAIGTVAAGLTVSLVVGVPLGSWISGDFGWHATFVLVAALSALAVAATAATLPHLPARPVARLREHLAPLRRAAVLTCVVGTVIGAAGGLMPYLFIAPILADATGADRGLLPLIIGLYGLAGVVGTIVGGRLNDRWGTDRAVIALLAVVAAATAAMAVLGALGAGRAPLWTLAILIGVWGAAGWAYNPPMNARALQLAGPAGTEAIALNTSGLYVGIAVAGAVGGGALDLGGGVGVLAAAGLIGALNLAVMVVFVRRHPAAPRPLT